jgi:hypothetical protein
MSYEKKKKELRIGKKKIYTKGNDNTPILAQIFNMKPFPNQ